MAITNFVPSVWSAAILQALETMLVYANPLVSNNDYEGEISQVGDSVRITTLGDVTVKDYTRNADMDAPETLTDAQLTLLIDQQKYFNFQVDDIDRRQAIPGLREEAARRVAYGLRKVMDSFMAAKYTDIATGNFIGSDVAPIVDFDSNATRAYDRLVDLGVLLDESDTPEEGRWAVIPPWYHGYLEKDDRFVGHGTAENRRTLENGVIGEAAGFTIMKSNQVPNTGGALHKVIAGHRDGWSHATQILDTEAYRPERRFADALKGLHVYGAKVIRPTQLACLVASDT